MDKPILATVEITFPLQDPQITGESQRAPEQTELCEGQVLRIGRAPSNDLVLYDPKVSRFHAILNASRLGIVLSDLSSLNGSFVNGRRISTPIDIRSGDLIWIGEARIEVFLAEEAHSQNETCPPQQTQALWMTHTVVTILLADICGYTKLSQALPPDNVAHMLDLWFQATSEIILVHGGEIDKFIGDCVMAIWQGTSEDATRSALSGIRAAQAIQEITQSLVQNGKWPHQQQYPWSCRVVLNSGTALLGPLGNSISRTFTVLGDEINFTFQLERFASTLPDAKLVLSSSTAKLVEGSIPLKCLGPATIEGRGNKTEVYTIES